MDNYQIFISYRREGGDALAGRLADRFVALGYKVFYDVESMRSGEFNTQLLTAIAQCEGVILVLPPNALDRCVNEDDWVRQEIAFALKQNKKIIPVIMRGFEFPATLPPDIEKIRFMEGVSASNEYFDAVIERIEILLKIKKPGSVAKKPQHKTANTMKTPLFLSTPDSKFASWALSCSKEIEIGHQIYINEQKSTQAQSLDDYLKQQHSKHIDYVKKCPKQHLKFNEEEAKTKYNFYQDFESESRRFLKVELMKLKIYDDTIVEQQLEMVVFLHNYISDLYKEKPAGYNARIAELLWLYFDFRYLSGDCMLSHSLLEHIFQNNYIPAIESKYYGETIHGIKRINKYEILKEVSYTVQFIETGIRKNDDKNMQLSLFLISVLFLYMLCECPQKAKVFQKYLLINYKYLSKKGVIFSEENEELFSRALKTCQMHIKLNHE